jgi:hypothetical protein
LLSISHFTYEASDYLLLPGFLLTSVTISHAGITSAVSAGFPRSRLLKYLTFQAHPPDSRVKYLSMIKVCAPHHVQLAINLVSRICFATFASAASILAVLLPFSNSSLQICTHEWRIDNRIFSTEEYGGMTFDEVVLPQYILGPKECPKQCMSYTHVLRAEIPEQPFIGELWSPKNLAG